MDAPAPSGSLFPILAAAKRKEDVNTDTLKWLINPSYKAAPLLMASTSANSTSPHEKKAEIDKTAKPPKRMRAIDFFDSSDEDDDNETLPDRSSMKRRRGDDIAGEDSAIATKRSDKEKVARIEQRLAKVGRASRQRQSSSSSSSMVLHSSGTSVTATGRRPASSLPDEESPYEWYPRGDPDNLTFESLNARDVPRYRPRAFNCMGKGRTERLRYSNRLNAYVCVDSRRADNLRSYTYTAAQRLADRVPEENLMCTADQADWPVNENVVPLQYNTPATKTAASVSKETNSSTPEEQALEKNKKLSEHCMYHPEDVNGWIKLAEWQLEWMEIYGGASGSDTMRGPVMEKQISILLKGLEHNPHSKLLLKTYISLCRRRFEEEKTMKLWERILRVSGGSHSGSGSGDQGGEGEVWRMYLRYRQTQFSTYSIETMRDAFSRALSNARKRRLAHMHVGDVSAVNAVEFDQLWLLRGICYVESMSGYTERAMALWQANIEHNFATVGSEGTQERELIEWWDQEGVRIGEKPPPSGQEQVRTGFRLWMEGQRDVIFPVPAQYQPIQESSSNDEGSEDPLSQCLRREHLCLSHPSTWMPLRSRDLASRDEEEEDAERVILGEDLAKFIVEVGCERMRAAMVTEFVDWMVRLGVGRGALAHMPYALWERGERGGGSIEAVAELEGGEDVSLVSDATLLEDICASEFVNDDAAAEAVFDLSLKGDVSRCSKYLHPEWANVVRRVLRAALVALPRSCAETLAIGLVNLEAHYVDHTSAVTASGGSGGVGSCLQDVLAANQDSTELWHAYAQSELIHGNVRQATKVYDMALRQMRGPVAQHCRYFKLFLAYAMIGLGILSTPTQKRERWTKHQEQEGLAILVSATEESFSGLPRRKKTKKKKCKGDASVQEDAGGSQIAATRIVHARKVYKDLMKSVLHRREGDEWTVYMLSCYAWLEYLLIDINAASAVFEIAISSVAWKGSWMKERCFDQYIHLMQVHASLQPTPPRLLRSLLMTALSYFPHNTSFVKLFMEGEKQSRLQARLRRYFDENCPKHYSPLLWLFAVQSEAGRAGAPNRIISLFERALDSEEMSSCVVLWRMYIAYLCKIGRRDQATRVYFRAIREAPFSKALWLDARHLRLEQKQLDDIVELMDAKEIRIRRELD